MAVMGCEEHRVPLALSENGEVTDAPFVGLVTVTLVGEVDAPDDAALTVMVTLVTQEAP
jgi:hypothetical protein